MTKFDINEMIGAITEELDQIDRNEQMNYNDYKNEEIATLCVLRYRMKRNGDSS